MRLEYDALNALRCRCRKCSSYPGVIKELKKQHFPGVYCAKGASRAGVVKEGCSCPECEVYREYGLDEEYYCIKGEARLLHPDRRDRVVVVHREKSPTTAVLSRGGQRLEVPEA